MKHNEDEVMVGQDSTDTSGGEEEEMANEEVEESDQSLNENGQNNIDDDNAEYDDDDEEIETEKSKRDDPDEEDNEEEEEEDDEDEDDDEEDEEDDEGSPVNHVVAAARTAHKFQDDDEEEEPNDANRVEDLGRHKVNGVKVEVLPKNEISTEHHRPNTEGSNQLFPADQHMDGAGTEEEQVAFMKELEGFFKEKHMEFKPPKFYGVGLNCLKLWREVIKLGGYDQVTSCKLWRQVGESFNPPKTCTTVSWSFRGFYEKALLEYEKHKMHGDEHHVPVALADPSSAERQVSGHQAPGSGRARRDAAARAMQGWHSQRLLGNGEVGDPVIIKQEKNPVSTPKRDKHLKSIAIASNVLKRKKASIMERSVKCASIIPGTAKPQVDTMVADIGSPADWVKINVRRTKDCFEVYALVPGLLREEVRVQSDPAGRLVISGDPENSDNPWGVTSFKKVISLPSRIDPQQTSAVVTLHGQLFVRVPFEQSDL